MALTELQKAVMRCLSKNRSEISYLAGGAVLNRNWPRLSEDLDIFHDTDEEIVAASDRDIRALESAGFLVTIDVKIYGCVEVRVRSTLMSETVIQWMSESKSRFFPIVRDEEWGARLHQCDLAVNKVIAASCRNKARDFVDLVMIEERMCRLGPLILAAAGKPPHYSPKKIVEEIRRRGGSIEDIDYQTVKGVSASMTPARIREVLNLALDRAEAFIEKAPVNLVGVLAVDEKGLPIEVLDLNSSAATLRKPTRTDEVMPAPLDAPVEWRM